MKTNKDMKRIDSICGVDILSSQPKVEKEELVTPNTEAESPNANQPTGVVKGRSTLKKLDFGQ